MADRDVQKIFRTNDFVITDCPTDATSFAAALRKLGSLSAVVDMQGTYVCDSYTSHKITVVNRSVYSCR